MSGLTAADYADTGQWRLIMKIHPNGVTAHIENILHKDLEPQLLFSVEWETTAENLLRNIENAVYDHPRVLDDFAARIIVYDSKTMFMPTELVEETEGAEESFYTSLYEADADDVMTDVDGDLTAAYSLAPGLKAFLSRTFPGAKVESNLMNKVKSLRGKHEGLRAYLDIRDGEADFILLDGRNLLSASTRPLRGDSDAAYHIFNLTDVYNILPEKIAVFTSGKPLSREIMDLFREKCGSCGETIVE